MACGHDMDVLVFPDGFRLVMFGSEYFFADILAVRARNVCLSCEKGHLASRGANEVPSADKTETGEARMNKSLGLMACGHLADDIRLFNGQRWIWFGPLENCLDVPKARARWVCQNCRNKHIANWTRGT